MIYVALSVTAALLLVGAFVLGRWSSASAAAQSALKDEREANEAAAKAREEIEAAEKEALAKIPTESTQELAKDIWGKEP